MPQLSPSVETIEGMKTMLMHMVRDTRKSSLRSDLLEFRNIPMEFLCIKLYFIHY